MTTVDDHLARWAYANGEDPIEWGVGVAADQIEIAGWVQTDRATNPASHPGYPAPLNEDAIARRIIGALLNAGWTPPTA